MRRPNFRPRVKQEAQHKINDRIRSPKVRLVGENVEPEVYTLEQALKLSDELELDLVEISPNADPPVCKILDYKKFLYEKKKKEKEIKAKTKKTVIKELRFGPNTDDHDFEFKAKHGEKFLEEGSKVKAYVHFKGRSIVFKDRGELLLLNLAKRLEEWGSPEQLPKLEGKRMIMVLSPKKKSK
ncbi:MAG: translation initiation factor IF-3 [Chitinophagales bacterium]|nr:translation initiation factor IF-3 [Chitinophagales bacterium]